MRTVALKWRVLSLTGLALVAAVTVICSVTYVETRELWFGQLDRVLESMAATAAAVLDDPSDETAKAAELQATMAVAQRRHVYFYRIWQAGTGGDLFNGGLAGRAGALREDLTGRTPPDVGRRKRFVAGSGEGAYRAYWTQVQAQRGPVFICVGLSMQDLRTELDELIHMLLIVGAAALAGSMIMVGLVIAWGLRPITRTAQRLVEVTERNVGSLRIDTVSVHAELRPFVHAVNDMLDRLDQAMEKQKSFVADASHELRTPLALAKSTVQLALSRDHAAAEYKQAMDEALSDLRRMEHLIDELMALARMDAAEPLEDMAPVDLANLLQDLASRRSPAAGGGEIACDLKSVTVRGSTLHLARLFGNLIDNAMQHGPSGGRITVSLRTQGDGWAAATVHDEGGAIPPEVQPRLFDRFFRADPSRSHATGGAGLGLAIAREIVLRHGGRIHIASAPGAGTTVSVLLPLPQA